MQPLKNDHLLQAYMDAIKMKLDDEFVGMLEQEIKRRNLLENPKFKARLDDFIISSLISPHRQQATNT